MSCQIPTQYCKSILSALLPYFLQVLSACAYSLLGALATTKGGLTAPAAPIVLLIVVSLFLAKCILNVYKKSYVFLAMSCWNAKWETLRALMLQCLMTYFVDLTIIMQVTFGFMVHAHLHLPAAWSSLPLRRTVIQR